MTGGVALGAVAEAPAVGERAGTGRGGGVEGDRGAVGERAGGADGDRAGGARHRARRHVEGDRAAVGAEEGEGDVVRGLGAAAERDRGGAAGRGERGEAPLVLARGRQALLGEGRDEVNLALGAVEGLERERRALGRVEAHLGGVAALAPADGGLVGDEPRVRRRVGAVGREARLDGEGVAGVAGRAGDVEAEPGAAVDQLAVGGGEGGERDPLAVGGARHVEACARRGRGRRRSRRWRGRGRRGCRP